MLEQLLRHFRRPIQQETRLSFDHVISYDTISKQEIEINMKPARTQTASLWSLYYHLSEGKAQF